MNKPKRDSAIIYRSFYEAIIDLPAENQIEVWNAVFEFSFNFKEVELNGISSTVFKLIKPNLEANNVRFTNGIKAKRKQNGSKTEANTKRTISKVEANKDKDVDKDNNKISFNEFYDLYDKKTDGVKAKLKWDKLDSETQAKIMAVVPEYVLSTPDKKYRKSPLVYLNNQCWLDEIIKPKEAELLPQSTPSTYPKLNIKADMEAEKERVRAETEQWNKENGLSS